MTNLTQKTAKAVLWSSVQNWGAQLFGTITVFVLARLVGPDSFGLIATAGIFTAFLQVFVSQGFALAIVQRENLEDEHLDTAFWINLVFSIFIMAICFYIAVPASRWFNQDELILVIRILSINFILIALSVVQEAILRRKFKFKLLAIRRLVSLLFSSIFGITAAFLGFGIWSLVIQQISGNVIGVITLWKVSHWRPKLNFSTSHGIELFQFGGNVLGVDILNFFNKRTDDILIGSFLGSVILGYYSVAYRAVESIANVLFGLVSQSSMSAFSRTQDDLQKAQHGFYKFVEFSSFVAFPISFFISAVSRDLVVIILGDQWLPCVPVLRVLVFITIVQTLDGINGSLIVSMGKPSWSLATNFFNTALNVIAFSIAIRWGLVAIALAYVLRGFILLPVRIILVRKLIRISIKKYFNIILPSIISSVSFFCLILIFRNISEGMIDPFFSLLCCSLIALFTYLALIKLISPAIYNEVFILSKIALFSK